MDDLKITIPASSAPTWMQCAGYPALAALVPKDDTESAREGTAAHKVAQMVLKSYQTDGGIKSASMFEGETIDDVLVTDEMVQAVEIYVMDVLQMVQKFGALQSLMIESPGNPAVRIHPANRCVIDSWFYDPGTMTLVVWDFKFGFTFVDAFENWQLINNAVAALELIFTDNGYQAPPEITIDMRIVQPRSWSELGVIRNWSIKEGDFRAYVNQMANQAGLAMSGKATTQTGDKCTHCRARHICPALLKASQIAMDVADKGTPIDLPPDAMAIELKFLQRAYDIIKARKDAIEADALAKMENGINVPDWEVKTNFGKPYWVAPDDEILALGSAFGANLIDEKLCSPAEAKKRGVDAAVINEYTSRRVSSKKLKPVNSQHVQKVFKP